MEYRGFTLDPFQEKAVRSIDQRHSVLVGAPTGTGKTLIAEYAVERSLECGQRVIYTAPIKALSNQKFHDFHARYDGRAGILTGDVSINQDADVVVMTTEILRNTMLEDPQRLERVAYVVFDEIHYVNDIERGTVWEESVILCPPHIALVCLSATAPNVEQFAEWIRSVHPIPVDVVVETQRAVPIETGFFADPIGLCDFETVCRASGLLKAKGYDWDRFEEEWHRRTGNRLVRRMSGKRRPRGTRQESHHAALRTIDYLAEHDRLPCLFFSPIRRLCEVRAEYLASRYHLEPEQEAEVLERFDALCRQQGLGKEAATRRMRGLVRFGVAYHHAGLLPALKVVIERLFATETFAVGVNMPARSVVFDGLEKFDGHSVRPLMAREFQQMSGRAGRRGIDERGYVYVQVDLAEFHPAAARHALFGKTEAIDSQFNLSYSSILNLYERFGREMYAVARRSFAHFQASGGAKSDAQAGVAVAQSRPLSSACGVPERFAEYEELKQRVLRARNEAAAARRAVRRRKNPDPELLAQERAAAAYYEELKSDLGEMECHRCRDAHACVRQAKARRRDKKHTRLLRRVRLELENRYESTFRERYNFLKELGYGSDEGLTSKGRIAKHIFGYEIQVTELLFDGTFERVNEEQMNALVGAIVFEAKRSEWYQERRVHPPLLEGARRRIDALVRREKRAGLASLGAAIKPLDLALTTTVEAWHRGVEFEELSTYTTASDGDLVRTFRLMLDLYRQIKRAVPEHGALVDKINRAIERIKRPPVDPEWELMHGEEDNAPVAPECGAGE